MISKRHIVNRTLMELYNSFILNHKNLLIHLMKHVENVVKLKVLKLII